MLGQLRRIPQTQLAFDVLAVGFHGLATQVELRLSPKRSLHIGERTALAGEAERSGVFLGIEAELTVE